MNVIKRDESIQKYDFEKIQTVVNNAFKSVNQDVPEKFVEQLKETFDKIKDKRETIDV